MKILINLKNNNHKFLVAMISIAFVFAILLITKTPTGEIYAKEIKQGKTEIKKDEILTLCTSKIEEKSQTPRLSDFKKEQYLESCSIKLTSILDNVTKTK